MTQIVTNNRVVGILLVFYPEYIDGATRQFNNFLKSISPNATLILVNNGAAIVSKKDGVLAVLQGNNNLREFSAWNTGFDYCRKNGLLENCNLLVFANDTFCHHNKFGVFTRFAFKNKFKRIMDESSKAAMAGEKFSLGLPYALNGLISNYWISTYLFSFNRSAFLKIKSLTPSIPIESFYTAGDNGIQFSELIGENLQKQITKWLTGSNATAWRGIKKTGQSGLMRLQGKANSIICEKYLSAFATTNEISLIDVFDKKYIIQLRKIESLIEKIGRLLGHKKTEIYHN